MKKNGLSGFKHLNTREYAVDIEETDDNKYEVKSYKLSFETYSEGAFHFHKNHGMFENLNDVYDFIKEYPLGPTDFIYELILKRKDTSKALTNEEQEFIDKLEILSRTANIRQVAVLTN